jgi:hypothetical protein
MLTWQGDSVSRLESARLLFGPELRMRASGRLIVAPDAEGTYSAEYELTIDESGVVRRVLVRSTELGHERQVSLSRSGEGNWLVDDGSGVRRGTYDGAVEVNIQDVLFTNALPIRRLNLHRESGEHTQPVIFVSLPELQVAVRQETYRTVSTLSASDDGKQRAVVCYETGGNEVDLTVTENGLVANFPGLAHLV